MKARTVDEAQVMQQGTCYASAQYHQYGTAYTAPMRTGTHSDHRPTWKW